MPGPRMGFDASQDAGELLRQVQTLRQQVDDLQKGLVSRQRVGFACGVLAERYGLSPEVAWGLLTRLSQTTNIKVRDIARVVHADLDGGVRSEDAEVAQRLNAEVEGALPLLSTIPTDDCGP